MGVGCLCANRCMIHNGLLKQEELETLEGGVPYLFNATIFHYKGYAILTLSVLAS